MSTQPMLQGSSINREIRQERYPKLSNKQRTTYIGRMKGKQKLENVANKTKWWYVVGHSVWFPVSG